MVLASVLRGVVGAEGIGLDSDERVSPCADLVGPDLVAGVLEIQVPLELRVDRVIDDDLTTQGRVDVDVLVLVEPHQVNRVGGHHDKAVRPKVRGRSRVKVEGRASLGDGRIIGYPVRVATREFGEHEELLQIAVAQEHRNAVELVVLVIQQHVGVVGKQGNLGAGRRIGAKDPLHLVATGRGVGTAVLVGDAAHVGVDLREDILVDFLTAGAHVVEDVLIDELLRVLANVHHVGIGERAQGRRKMLVDVHRHAVFLRLRALIANARHVGIGEPFARLGPGLVVEFGFDVLLAGLGIGQIEFDRTVIRGKNQIKGTGPAGKPERGVLFGEVGKLARDLRACTGQVYEGRGGQYKSTGFGVTRQHDVEDECEGKYPRKGVFGEFHGRIEFEKSSP